MKLKIQGIGEVPSMKNSKMIARGRLMTDPRKQHWMEAAQGLLQSQLNCFILAKGLQTLTGEQLLASIASFVPLDDSRQWIAKLNVSWRQVSKGEEGAEIEIEITTPRMNEV